MRADNGTVEFRRRYLWAGPRAIRFRTELRLPGPGTDRVVRNDIPLFPLYVDEFRGMLEGAGFERLELYGDFARAAFSPDSEAVVCVARKR